MMMPKSQRVAGQHGGNGGRSDAHAPCPAGAALASAWQGCATEKRETLKQQQTDLLRAIEKLEAVSQRPTDEWFEFVQKLLRVNAEISPVRSSAEVTVDAQLAKFKTRLATCGERSASISTDGSLALIEALNLCAQRKVQMPSWLCREVAARTRRVLDHQVSLDDAFGLGAVSSPKSKMAARRRKQMLQAEYLLPLVEWVQATEKCSRSAAIKRVLERTPQPHPFKQRKAEKLLDEVGKSLGASSLKPRANHITRSQGRA
jgi:hypothetical protein